MPEKPETPPRPTDGELEILTVLWSRGPSTVREVHEAITRRKPAQYTTVLKLLQIMAEKGLVRRNAEMRAHVYQASRPKEWTQRQLAYSALFKAQAYTPQMVVDGQVQFVGSNAQDASLAIANAVDRVETEVAVTREKPDANGSQQLTVSIGKLTGNTPLDVAEVWLAVTEDGLESSVNRGENSGRVLHHAATLRSLHKIGVADPNKSPASFAGDSRVKFDSHWNAKNLRVVVFIQEKKSRKILGANSMKIAS